MSVDIFGRSSSTNKKIILKGPPGVGFSLTDSGNFDIEHKRLCNVGEPVDSQDAVNLKEFLEYKKVIEIELNKQEEKIARIDKVANDLIYKIDSFISILQTSIDKLDEKQRDSSYMRSMLGIWR
jgi:hypothetical protein